MTEGRFQLNCVKLPVFLHVDSAFVTQLLASFPTSLFCFTNIILTHHIFIINSFNFCYREIKHLFLFEHSLPCKLRNTWLTATATPQSLCKHEFTGCCAGTFGDLLSGYWDLFIFWWTGKLWGHGPCQVFRYQLKKPCWKNCGWHSNTENDRWCIIYF